MTGESPKQAPAAIIVLGSLWLVAAVGSLACAVGIVVLFGIVAHLGPAGGDPFPPAPPLAKTLYWAFQHFLVVGSLQGALSLLGIYSGIQFLRLEGWARTFLEAAGWTAIALSVGLGIWQSGFWLASGPSAATGHGGSFDGPVALAARLVAGLMVAAYFAVFPATFVWLLRSRWVLPAFASGGRPSSGAG